MITHNERVVTNKKDPSGGEVGEPQNRLRKANEAIAIKPTSGKMTFLSRKVFNSLLFHAQKQGDQSIYKVPLTDFVGTLDYGSRDIKLLQDHLRRMVETTVEWNDTNKRWGVGSLLGEAEIKFDGRNSTVEWSYTPKVRELLLDPERYTPISLAYQAILKTHASLVLFEICSRYETNPSGLTNRASPEWWYPVLSGNSQWTPEPHFYRYFKRDTLSPALHEINTLTQLSIELVEHKKGRKVIEIQFSVATKQQANLDLPAPPIIDTQLMDRISAFGIPKSEAEEIFASHPEAALRATITLVEDRMKNRKLPELDSPAAFFKSALRHGYAAQKPEAPKPVLPSSDVSVTTVKSDEQIKREKERVAAREHYAKLDEGTRIALLSEFESVMQENPIISRNLRRQGLESKIVESTFMGWLSNRLAG